jgi:hypothetical protein
MKMEQTKCSETLSHKIQTSGNHQQESIQHSEQGEFEIKDYFYLFSFILLNSLPFVFGWIFGKVYGLVSSPFQDHPVSTRLMQKQPKPTDGYVRECITGNEVGDCNLACNRARQLIGLHTLIEQSLLSRAGGHLEAN